MNRERKDRHAERAAIDRWLTRLLRDVLGYADLTTAPEPRIGDRSFPIRHRAHRDTLPLLLTVPAYDLDRSDKAFASKAAAAARTRHYRNTSTPDRPCSGVSFPTVSACACCGTIPP